MKYIIAFVFFLIGFGVKAQYRELKIHSNGLMYSESTMGKLRLIVDSLNLKYKNCGQDKICHSLQQAKSVFFTIKDSNLQKIMLDLDSEISFEQFKTKYPHAQFSTEIEVIHSSYLDQQKKMHEFSAYDRNYGWRTLTIEDQKNSGVLDSVKLVYNLYNYKEPFVHGYFLLDEFRSVPLKPEYCKLIQYADCLMDSTYRRNVYNLPVGYVPLPENWEYYSTWRKQKLLKDMQSVRVIGNCSGDGRPRINAMNIAVLSAATANWQVFLRAHLDILNDRFERLSDGSYAWKSRGTYLRELEELEINVPDMMFGILLRVSEEAPGHYRGNIHRVGRALAESRDRSLIENRFCAFIADSLLDNYNRMIMAYTFQSYIQYIPDDDKEAVLNRFMEAIGTLPENLQYAFLR